MASTHPFSATATASFGKVAWKTHHGTSRFNECGCRLGPANTECTETQVYVEMAWNVGAGVMCYQDRGFQNGRQKATSQPKRPACHMTPQGVSAHHTRTQWSVSSGLAARRFRTASEPIGLLPNERPHQLRAAASAQLANPHAELLRQKRADEPHLPNPRDATTINAAPPSTKRQL